MKSGVRIIMMLVLAMLGVAGMHAETVSQKMASRVAQAFFNTMYGYETQRPKLVWNGRELTTNRLFTPFYVYNSPQGGFVAIVADSKAFPVLAYSRVNRFDKAMLGDRERDQFTRFAREVELIRYDSRIPDKAKHAWENLPEYITGVLGNPYNTDEYRRLNDDVKREIEDMDRRNAWIIMPTAVEFDLYRPEQYRDYTLDDVLAEEVPFTFYDTFIEEIRQEEAARTAALEKILHPVEPVVHRLGGSHFSIDFPEEPRVLRVYSINGSRVMEKTFSGQNVVAFDLAGQPSGFYVAMVLTDNGKVYGFKVYR